MQVCNHVVSLRKKRRKEKSRWNSLLTKIYITKKTRMPSFAGFCLIKRPTFDEFERLGCVKLMFFQLMSSLWSIILDVTWFYKILFCRILRKKNKTYFLFLFQDKSFFFKIPLNHSKLCGSEPFTECFTLTTPLKVHWPTILSDEIDFFVSQFNFSFKPLWKMV